MPIGGNISGGGGGGGAADESWFDEYFIDFTAQDSETFSDGETKDLEGVEWRAELDDGGGTVGTAEIINGTGLQITATGSGHNLGDGITSPWFSVKLLDVMSDLSNRDTIAVQVLLSEDQDLDATFEGWGTALYTPTTDPQDVTKILFFKCYFGNTSRRVYRVGGFDNTYSAEQNDALDPGSTARDNLAETIYSFTGATGIMGHATSTSTTATPYQVATANRNWVSTNVVATTTGSTTEPSWDLQSDSARFGFGVFSVNDLTPDFSCTITAVRILRLGGSGGGAG